MDTYAIWKAKYLADETALFYQAWLEQEVARLAAIEARATRLNVRVEKGYTRVFPGDLQFILTGAIEASGYALAQEGESNGN